MDTNLITIIGLLFLVGLVVIASVSMFMKNKKAVKPLWSLFFTVQIIAVLIIIPAWMGKIPFFFAITFIAIKSQHELIRTTIENPKPLFINIIFFAGVMIMVSGFNSNEAAMLYLIPGVLSLLLFLDLFRADDHDSRNEIGKLIFSLIYPVTFMAFFMLLYNLKRGTDLVLFLYVVSEVNDSFAQLMGRILGEKKIFPRLSPNKTWAGLLWGILFALTTGIIANHFTFGFTIASLIPGIMLIITGSILGDLIPSRIKRDHKVKDFGNFLPLHGGILDTYDSLIFTAPFFYWYAILFLS